MFFYEGQRCPVCNQLFSETDDIVSCPDCGAPHHRACWMAEGRCHFAADHGTENQWKRVRVTEEEPDEDDEDEEEEFLNRCPNCGSDNPEHAEFCGYCGRPLNSQEWSSQQPRYNQYRPPVNEYVPFRASFDPLGGVEKDERFDGEVTAEDLAAYVAANTTYYIPRFKRLKDGASFQWNWSAFLFAPCWLFFRKQYLAGILVSLPYLAMMTMLKQILVKSTTAGAVSYFDMANEVMRAGYTVPFLLLTVGILALCLLMGLFGNRIYMEGAIRSVKRVKEQQPEDMFLALRRAGGLSFLWCAAAYSLLNLLSTLLILLL